MKKTLVLEMELDEFLLMRRVVAERMLDLQIEIKTLNSRKQRVGILDANDQEGLLEAESKLFETIKLHELLK